MTGVAIVEELIKKTGELRVLVIGETIIDEFIRVEYEGHSMKSFCPVFRVDNQHEALRQQGGALAIANHLRDFVQHVDLLTNGQDEIVKTRYIDTQSMQKHVEVNRFNVKPLTDEIEAADYDVIIVADFGHGLCDNLDLPDGVHLMCQTNSNNFGFNRVSKWKAIDKASVCIDLREASLQMNKKVDLKTQGELEELYGYELNTQDLYVTLGRSGVIFTNGEEIEQYPSFKTEVVDTIGAGDAFFAFASLMSHLDWPVYDRLLIPSLAASLTTTWLANEDHVSKSNLLQHAMDNL